MNYVSSTVIVGVGATVIMDLWAVARQSLLGTSLPNYGLVGRWLAYMTRGRFVHESIAAAPPINGERLIGWVAHYLIGVTFAAVLLGIGGEAWIQHPSLGLALLVGIGTVAAPFLLMQPGMGAGIAASRTPRPAAARLQSLITHSFFGIALYFAGWIANYLQSP